MCGERSCNLSSWYNNIFNAEVSETSFSSFCELYEVKSIINKSTCYNNPTKPYCIDLFLTNSPNSFQKSTVVEAGLSVFHKTIVMVMKSYSPKRTPNIINNRKYTYFGKDKLMNFYWWIFFNLPKHNLQQLTLEALWTKLRWNNWEIGDRYVKNLRMFSP